MTHSFEDEDRALEAAEQAYDDAWTEARSKLEKISKRDRIRCAIAAYRAARARPASAPRIEWRADGFGKPGTALYLGNLYVGSINHWDTKRTSEPWRGWFMSDDEGAETGWFVSEDEARKSVEAALQNALAAEPASGVKGTAMSKDTFDFAAPVPWDDEEERTAAPPPPPTQGEEETARELLNYILDATWTPIEPVVAHVAAALRQRADEAARAALQDCVLIIEAEQADWRGSDGSIERIKAAIRARIAPPT